MFRKEENGEVHHLSLVTTVVSAVLETSLIIRMIFYVKSSNISFKSCKIFSYGKELRFICFFLLLLQLKIFRQKGK